MNQRNKISRAVKDQFTIGRLGWVWPELIKLGFNSQAVAADVWGRFNALPEPKGGQSTFFLKYGLEVLEPQINERLGHPPGYPSFNELMERALKQFITLTAYQRIGMPEFDDD